MLIFMLVVAPKQGLLGQPVAVVPNRLLGAVLAVLVAAQVPPVVVAEVLVAEPMPVAAEEQPVVVQRQLVGPAEALLAVLGRLR